MSALYWPVFFALAALVVLAIWRIDRLGEMHHAWIGIALAALPWWPARLAALVLLADELYQHGTQAIEAMRGLPMRPDFSPIHRAYVTAVTWLTHVLRN